MSEILARAEMETLPNRELDADIARALGMIPVLARFDGSTAWCGGLGYIVAPFTANVDAALTLVPRGWIVSILRDFDCDGEFFATVTLTDSFTVGRGCEDDEKISVTARKAAGKAFHDPTPVAVCAAALRARLAPPSRV